jgi:hypothetical protein
MATFRRSVARNFDNSAFRNPSLRRPLAETAWAVISRRAHVDNSPQKVEQTKTNTQRPVRHI